MKLICVAFTVAMAGLAALSLWIASQAPFRAELKMPTPGYLTCGAGYYNETYYLIALAALGAAVFVAFMTWDKVKE